MLEKLLLSPTKLAEQWTFQFDPAMQTMVVQKYYDLDDIVIREIIGKKLSGRTRKDIDDISEKTGVLLRSCRRQFDNVKRVFKHVDELPGSTATNIQSHFLLPIGLAKKYAAVIFLMNNRFETNKRKLHYLTFEDFSVCAFSMMNNWTCGVGSKQDSRDDSDIEREFLSDLRDIKVLVDKEKEHKSLTLGLLRGKVADRMCTEAENNFKSYSRALINIGCSLNNSRDLRDFFVDIVEKVVDPCKQARWKVRELEIFLQAYHEAAIGLDVMANDAGLRSTWHKYITTMSVYFVPSFPKPYPPFGLVTLVNRVKAKDPSAPKASLTRG
ncbi:acidic fibroblast growth factor intracellular-binding protein-like [Oratosquilla oratoria]|uniref:acidic fibroblast growth factor intracellular-binding protein-like n=1 Tax=Oratosquilla oratoria TaxID=337810 RepID=UPI003F75CC57